MSKYLGVMCEIKVGYLCNLVKKFIKALSNHISTIGHELINSPLTLTLNLYSENKIWETLGTWFWDKRWPKRTPTWAKFLVEFWGPDPYRRRRGGHVLFPASKGHRPKKNRNHKQSSITVIFYQQSIDHNFLSSHKKVSVQLATKRMPMYGITGIFKEFFAPNLAKS